MFAYISAVENPFNFVSQFGELETDVFEIFSILWKGFNEFHEP